MLHIIFFTYMIDKKFDKSEDKHGKVKLFHLHMIVKHATKLAKHEFDHLPSRICNFCIIM